MAPATSSWNPLAFVPRQVTLLTSTLYLALAAVLLYVHHAVPLPPADPTPTPGVNLTAAWGDLEVLAREAHPFDSRRDGVVAAWLRGRVEGVVGGRAGGWVGEGDVKGDKKGDKKGENEDVDWDRDVVLMNDRTSNATFFSPGRGLCYGESENLIVYIRGTEDPAGAWWTGPDRLKHAPALTLVNAHYDSVSTAPGATDDGIGVVTLLQLLSRYTQSQEGEGEGRSLLPANGLVLLFNSFEEPGLYGAHAFMAHPIARYTTKFLNLEGAGAGGRATLFRSTDAEVTGFYARAARPFGTVVSGDGFKRGLIRSGTDYSVFSEGAKGMRGLDVAFYAPRSRYHTDQDSVREAGRGSLWHMLETSLSVVEGMVEEEGERDGVAGTRSEGVWFDVLGRGFAVARLRTLFGLSVALLVAGPVLLILLQVIIVKCDKWYPMSRRQYLHGPDDDEAVHFSGVRGLFRFPLAIVLATAAVLALAYLVTKINPFIVYSSEYAVWAMMLSAWLAIAWLFLTGADRIRPTALQRMYVLIWLYALSWIALVGATVGESVLKMGSAYFIVIYNAAVWAALLISYLELFALPTKTSYVEHVAGLDEEIEDRSARPGSQSSRTLLGPSGSRGRAQAGTDDDEANERTSLLRGRDRREGGTFTGFNKSRHPDTDGTLDESEDPTLTKAYGDEQAWSSSLPQWTWVLQFILVAPINLIIMGQIGLISVASLHQTLADGNSPLIVYLFTAALSIALLLPTTPFLHRLTYQVPTFLFFIFLGCLAYTLLAFPFSRDARLKVYFTQHVDVDTGANNVTLTGVPGYLQQIIADIPSAAPQQIHCSDTPADPSRAGLQTCSWPGPAPDIAPSASSLAASSLLEKSPTAHWLNTSITHANASAVHFTLSGLNAKHCRLTFASPPSSIRIANTTSPAPAIPSSEDDETVAVRLLAREFNTTFEVDVEWAASDYESDVEGEGKGKGSAKGQKGAMGCLWSDLSEGAIPAFEEVRAFLPVWAAVTKGGDGLVEGWRGFEI